MLDTRLLAVLEVSENQPGADISSLITLLEKEARWVTSSRDQQLDWPKVAQITNMEVDYWLKHSRSGLIRNVRTAAKDVHQPTSVVLQLIAQPSLHFIALISLVLTQAVPA
jgi:hypothetical protein